MMSLASASRTATTTATAHSIPLTPTRRASLRSGSLLGSSTLTAPALVVPYLRYNLGGLTAPQPVEECALSDEEGALLKASASPAQLAYFEQLTNMFEDEADAKMTFGPAPEYKETDPGRLSGNENCCTIS